MKKNSPLAAYVRISPNRTSPRAHKIDTLTIHCVEGQCTVEALGALFADPKRRASSNYGIGYDGKIGLYVEEGDRSWCSGSRENDHRAVTIEVASDKKPPYAVTKEAYDALIELAADLCRRNGIDALRWQNDKTLVGQPEKQNMTLHRWFADTSCPGEYLAGRMGDIAEKVNERLKEAENVPPAADAGRDSGAAAAKIWRVQAGAYLVKKNAEKKIAALKSAGFSAYANRSGLLYVVYAGAYVVRSNAEKTKNAVRAAGFSAVIVEGGA